MAEQRPGALFTGKLTGVIPPQEHDGPFIGRKHHGVFIAFIPRRSEMVDPEFVLPAIGGAVEAGPILRSPLITQRKALMPLPRGLPEPVAKVRHASRRAPVHSIGGEKDHGLIVAALRILAIHIVLHRIEQQLPPRGDGELGVSQIQAFAFQQSCRFPCFTLFGMKDAHLAIIALLSMPRTFPECAEPLALVILQIGEGIVGCGIPDFPHLEQLGLDTLGLDASPAQHQKPRCQPPASRREKSIQDR